MKPACSLRRLVASVAVFGNLAAALELDLTSESSIKEAASNIAYGMVQWYTGNRTGDVPGNLPQPYYWWEAGAMFGSLIDYWYYTGDSSYNKITTEAMLHQVGLYTAFMPENQTSTEGNDDQAFWGMAAMSAAEANFPNPPKDQPQWLELVQGVFNTQASRWETTKCNGGLRWQIFNWNRGFTYKNTISNGCFFNIGARLARYTGNSTYAKWAEKTWDWVEAVGLMSESYDFFDGTDMLINCTEVNHDQWSYNAGVFLQGAATMWSVTKSDVWKERVLGILGAAQKRFFKDQVMYEWMCEPSGKCNVDQRSFKAYLARNLAATVKVAPFTNDTIMPLLQASAKGAAAQCSGTAGPYGARGNVCGMKWVNGANYDGSYGVGEQMAALEVIQSNMIPFVDVPLTDKTGGTSKGDPSAGSGATNNPIHWKPITTADRAGSIILTLLVLSAVLGGAFWMVNGS